MEISNQTNSLDSALKQNTSDDADWLLCGFKQIQKEIACLLEAKRNADSKICSLIHELKEMRAALQQAESELKALHEQSGAVQTLRTEKLASDAALLKAQDKIVQLKAQKEAVELKMTELHGTYAIAMDDSLNEKDEEISHLMNELQQKEGAKRNLEHDLLAERKEREKQQTEMERLRQVVQSYETSVPVRIQQMRSEYDSHAKQLEHRMLSTSKREVDTIKKMEFDYEKKLRDLKAQHAAELHRMQADMAGLRLEMAEMNWQRPRAAALWLPVSSATTSGGGASKKSTAGIASGSRFATPAAKKRKLLPENPQVFLD